jgi:hypothetical protein
MITRLNFTVGIMFESVVALIVYIVQVLRTSQCCVTALRAYSWHLPLKSVGRDMRILSFFYWMFVCRLSYVTTTQPFVFVANRSRTRKRKNILTKPRRSILPATWPKTTLYLTAVVGC